MMSAPLCLMTSSGSSELPSDFDIFLSSSAMMNPLVTTCRNGGRPRFPHQRGRHDRFAALGAVDRRNRHTPDALARNAPVGTVGHHVVHPVVAPPRNPLHVVVDRVERRLTQRFVICAAVRLKASTTG